MRGDRRRSVAVIVRVDRLPFGGGPISSFVAVSVLVFFDEVFSEAAAHEDAGRITFAAGTMVDRTKAVGYNQVSIYCVAPIVDSSARGGRYKSTDSLM